MSEPILGIESLILDRGRSRRMLLTCPPKNMITLHSQNSIDLGNFNLSKIIPQMLANMLLSDFLMGRFTTVTFVITKGRERANRFGLTDRDTRESGRTIWRKVQASLQTKMGTNIKVSGSIVLLRVLEFLLIQKGKSTKGFGKRMNRMEKEKRTGKMVVFTKVSIGMELNRVLGCRVFQMEIYTKGTGRTTSFTGRASSR